MINNYGGSGITRFQAVLSKSKSSSNQPVVPDTVQTPVAPNYGGTGVIRLQAVLAKANLARQDNPASPPNNQGNLYISQDALGYNTPMSAEEQLKLASKYADKAMEKEAAIGGVASLQNAFGRTGGFSTVFGSYTPR